jgi:hypothetical protein
LSEHHIEAPLTPEQLWRLDDPMVVDDTRPFGLVTESATAFWTDEPVGVELVRTDDSETRFALRSRGLIHHGLPVLEVKQGQTITRSLEERLQAATQRDRGEWRAHADRRTVGEAYCPVGVPTGIHPKVVASLGNPRFGISARGSKTRLSEDPHSTIINGESRQFLYPDRYPYTAVCKLLVEYQPRPDGGYIDSGEATGFLIGKSTMVTSGHVRPPGGVPWRIRVTPACWAGRSIFGSGMVTYVRSAHWWHSDSGNDIQICQLYDTIGDRLGYFGFRNYDSDWEDIQVWTMAGFPYDRSLTSMSVQFGIAVRDDDDGDDINVDGNTFDTTQVENDADEASGASGSPLFAWWPKGPYAIGVHHGVERDGTISGTEILSCASGGDGFVAAAHWARSMWG